MLNENPTSSINHLTVRVYGILINQENQVLVTDELIRGNYITKFPGGGLELGEGTRDCLQREFLEEANLQVFVGKHIYTTDFFQPSAFNPSHQILSIYYEVTVLEPFELITQKTPFNFSVQQKEDTSNCFELFRWIDWNDLNESDLTLPIDKKVVSILKGN